jgi:hypothetical protein
MFFILIDKIFKNTQFHFKVILWANMLEKDKKIVILPNKKNKYF